MVHSTTSPAGSQLQHKVMYRCRQLPVSCQQRLKKTVAPTAFGNQPQVQPEVGLSDRRRVSAEVSPGAAFYGVYGIHCIDPRTQGIVHSGTYSFWKYGAQRWSNMRLFSSYSWVPALAAALLFISCESTEPKRAPATPPANAQAPTLTEPAPTASTPAPKAVQPAPPPIDPVEATLSAAEREYQAGRANYDAGHLEAAKENFDRAFDLLLAGPVELKSEERLQREFDKIVEGVHQLELLALKAGDGFTEQQVEPAPIDEANEVTFPVTPVSKPWRSRNWRPPSPTCRWS